jgi:nitrite reductase/ring-hydroxylating ferredoxin subunit
MAGRPLEIVKLAQGPDIGAVEICSADQLWDGEMECFRARDTTILLLKINGQFHAYQGRCPHQGASLAEGELAGGLLTCTAHRWQFDARNGQGVNPRSARLKCFPVRVVERKVLIEMALGEIKDSELQSCGGDNERRSP